MKEKSENVRKDVLIEQQNVKIKNMQKALFDAQHNLIHAIDITQRTVAMVRGFGRGD